MFESTHFRQEHKRGFTITEQCFNLRSQNLIFFSTGDGLSFSHLCTFLYCPLTNTSLALNPSFSLNVPSVGQQERSCSEFLRWFCFCKISPLPTKCLVVPYFELTLKNNQTIYCALNMPTPLPPPRVPLPPPVSLPLLPGVASLQGPCIRHQQCVVCPPQRWSVWNRELHLLRC